MLKIWDLPTRIYHWLQALLFAGLVASGYGFAGTEGMHLLFGLALFVLIIWRIGWGIIGSETSRFINFLPSPGRLWAYLSGRQKHYLGHNPLGGLMVLLMITLILLQAFSGLYLSELVDGRSVFGRQTMKMLEQFHRLNAVILIGSCIFHVLAVVAYQLRGKQLTKIMITGCKETSEHLRQPVIAGNKKAMVLFIISITTALFIMQLSM
ncbi:cytochrome b/b6 domain-containing protein [Thalassomonas viridans]|uniref:Cytochrome b/b6 domain-containing protein n=1 Tax=Thalassomonas viridans TaxID=137584 RepID=A0AAE9Z8M7_9GAMM|nr:cytochrome b/b6 domain-containing protein [Thalassomonas viridans]WDE08721.1 cytochrome b/b6 domain-containing protein [Thalassomonas viridans]